MTHAHLMLHECKSPATVKESWPCGHEHESFNAALRLEKIVMAGFFVSIREHDDILAKAESTLIDRCLPALAVLEKHGILYVSLDVRVEDWSVVDNWVRTPRFVDGIGVPKKYHAEVCAAIGDLRLAISHAIEDTINHGAGDADDVPAGFYADVSLNQRNDGHGWSICCAVSATVADDRPSLVIKLS